jgi:hypothetical protein
MVLHLAEAQKQRMAAPNFADLADLKAKVLAFIAERNHRAHPFSWTQSSFEKILSKVDATPR